MTGRWTKHQYNRQRDCWCASCVQQAQMALFGPPDKPAPHMAAKPAAATYARVTPRTRVLCHDCVRDIHERGTDVAPPPRAVRWRRRHGNETQMLCEQHKDARQENEL